MVGLDIKKSSVKEDLKVDYFLFDYIAAAKRSATLFQLTTFQKAPR